MLKQALHERDRGCFVYYEVYLDFYFLENLFTDCVLLYLTAMALRCQVKGRYIFLAGFFGSISSCLLLLLPWKNPIFTIVFQALTARCMVRRSLGKRDGKELLCGMVVLVLNSFLMGGAIQAAAEILHLSMPVTQAGVLFILAVLLWLYAGAWCHTRALQSATVTLHGKSREVGALYDTGNRLREPYKKRPVNIIEYEAVRELLGGDEKFFLIPCRTVGGGSQMLEGMVFDCLSVAKGGKSEKYEHPVIAFTKERLSSDGSYQMILHPDNRND